jgi:phage FluMu gp28-like protein
MGIDFARKRNLTSIQVLEDKDGIFRLLYAQDLKKMPFTEQVIFIVDAANRLKADRVIIDETGLGLPMTDHLTEQLGSRVEGVTFTRHNKEKIIMDLRACFEDNKLAIPDDETLYDQLHSFQKDVTEQGNIRLTGKVDETDFLDDRVIALSLAVYGLNQSPFDFAIV